MAKSTVVYKSEIDDSIFESEAEANYYDATLRNKERIEAFVNKHYPKPDGVALDREGNPKLTATGKPIKKVRQDRPIVKKAIALWLAENQ